MAASKSEFAAVVLEHLRAIRAGSCTLAQEDIDQEDDPAVKELLEELRALQEQQAEVCVQSDHERQHRLTQAILDALPVNVFMKDSKGRFVHWNQQTAENVGVSKERAIGNTDYDVFPTDVADRLRAVDQQVLAKGQRIFTEEQVRIDGDERVYFAGKLPLRVDGFDETFLLGFSLDITKQKRIARDLDAQREFIQQVLDHDPNLIFVKDARGNFLLVNQAVAKLFGKSVDELTDVSNYAVHASPEEVDAYNETDQRVIENLESIKLEEPFSLSDGSTRWFETFKTPLRRANGEVCVLGISIDITERKLEQMKDARFTAIIESSVDAIVSLDRRGRIIYWNPAAEALLGYTREEAVGMSVFSMSPERMRDDTKALVARLWAGESQPPFETRRLHKDGHEVDVVLSVSPVRLPDGEVVGLASILRDVTERKEFERELVLAKEQAETATVAKSQFLANISHEIRTPLNGVIGMTSLLFTTELDEEQRGYVESIEISGNTLLTLINDILDFSKMESEQLRLQREPFGVLECVNKAVSMSSSMAGQRDLHLSTDVDTELPRYIVGDPTRLLQVLCNLINNAVKFTEAGRVAVSVGLVHHSGDDVELLFSVQDTGIGIPASKLDTLFERFTQVDTSATRKYGGTGLGLAISKRLVELMGGRIWVESEEGRGSTFSFTMHATVASEAVDEVQASRPEVAAAGSRPDARRALKILVAEDNLVNQKVAVGLLRRLGHEIDVAENGASVLAALAQRRYDVVFMDLHMPVMDGVVTTQRIIERCPASQRPVIVAMTADAMHGDREYCLEIGMQDYISKPVTLEKLSSVLDTWCSGDDGGPGAHGGEALVDRELFDSYGVELMRELWQTFVDTVPPRLERMRRLYEAGDMSALSEEAHTLKGTGLNLGVQRFAALCRDLELRSRSGDVSTGVGDLLATLEQSYQDSRDALAALLAGC
ncbi:PAS domain S-box protein [Haliangium sp.]|uniref:PAS domain S-box protein n=1 Tax=Haliangium sp. TaxID=2663208 RepID=UPI003D0EBE5E